ncbi:EthD family reductase [Actinosynnema sp. NPDC091369]
MIHQLIFAAPKPGMTVEEFQDYWLNVHAVRYASKIPQIKKYMIDTTIPFDLGNGDPKWSGVAEIWLNNDEEQLASLQTEEFLQGARLDEPKWAAFWQTLVLDTDAHELKAGPELVKDQGWVKLIILVKRREGMPLADFREYSLGTHGELTLKVPGLRRYLQGHTRDGWYGIGEPTLDAAYQLWFDDVDALRDALDSPEFKQVVEDYQAFVNTRYVHRLVTAEHWVIGPDARP